MSLFFFLCFCRWCVCDVFFSFFLLLPICSPFPHCPSRVTIVSSVGVSGPDNATERKIHVPSCRDWVSYVKLHPEQIVAVISSHQKTKETAEAHTTSMCCVFFFHFVGALGQIVEVAVVLDLRLPVAFPSGVNTDFTPRSSWQMGQVVRHSHGSVNRARCLFFYDLRIQVSFRFDV